MDNKKKIDDELEALSPEEVKAIGEIEIGPSKQDQFLNKHYKKLIVGGITLMVVISTGIIIGTSIQQHKEAGAAALMEAASKNDSKALTAVQDEYSGTDSADTARLFQGLSLLRSDSTAAQGVTALQEFAASSGNELLRARALSAVAFHYMGCISSADKESVSKAEEAWKSVIELPVNPYTAVAYVSLGDLAKSQGHADMARTYYARLSEVCPHCAVTSESVTQLRAQLLETDAPESIKPLPTTPTSDPSGLTPSFTLPGLGGGEGSSETPAAPAGDLGLPSLGTPTGSGLLPGTLTPETPAEAPAAPETPAEAPAAPETPAETPATPEAPAETPAAPEA